MKNNLQSPSRQAKKAFSVSNWQSNKDIVCDEYKKDTDKYVRKLIGAKREVSRYFLKNRRFKNGMKRSNRKIAANVGYSIRTVIRVTNQLQRDGLILKYHIGDRSKNVYYYHDLFIEERQSFTFWDRVSLTVAQRDGYLEKGKAGIVRIPYKSVMLTKIKENTMAKVSTPEQEIGSQLPQHVRTGVAMASAYGTSRVKNFSNGNGEGFELVVWHHGDKSVDKTSVEENIHPNGSCPLCFLCTKNLDECICSGDAKHDTFIDHQYMH